MFRCERDSTEAGEREEIRINRLTGSWLNSREVIRWWYRQFIQNLNLIVSCVPVSLS
jgi:hypothetical protein